MSAPAVSVVMPVYNASAYLAEAVKSVLAQTFDDFELIAVNDGSTDRSGPILDEFSRADRRVRVIHKPNGGIVSALNEALAAAEAPLIARMDGDDVCTPQRFHRQVDYLKQNPDCVALGGRVIGIDPYGCILFRSEHKLSHAEIDAELLKGVGWAIVHPAAMFRRDALQRIGGYRPEFQWVEDLDLFLRLAEIGRLANLPDELLMYRQHTQSVNRTRGDEQAKLADACVRDAYKRRGREVPDGWKFVPKVKPSRDAQLRTWAWRAIQDGNVLAARKHAVALLKGSPLSFESWRTLACAIRGY